jgi:hypothetical protein
MAVEYHMVDAGLVEDMRDKGQQLRAPPALLILSRPSVALVAFLAGTYASVPLR